VIVAYTDGACSGNPGPGGWAWAVAPDGEPSDSGGEPMTTNQRMELLAALEALRTLGSRGETVRIVSDSIYVVKCFTDKWWVRWEANGYRNSNKHPVANADLWKPLVEFERAGNVEWAWVKGHSGDRLNDLVDRMAVAAIVR
jgi:ribonuclease HI